jgi:phosphonate transport system substrate-binding protein
MPNQLPRNLHSRILRRLSVSLRKLISAVLLTLLCAGATAAETSYSIAIVPQYPPAEIHRDWTPLLERIRLETGINLTLSIAASIPAFEVGLFSGEPDFAYMNPYHEVMAMRAKGYLPLVRDSTPLSGILMVRKDDPITSVKQLDGKEIAFPAPNAFGASLWMRALLAEREKIHITPLYVKTHSNAYRYVVTGKAVACGGVNHTLSEEPAEVRDSLRVLLETPGVPSHPLSAHPRVPEPVRRKLAEFLLSLPEMAGGPALLKGVQMASPVRADYARDYRPLEKYGLDNYVVRATAP